MGFRITTQNEYVVRRGSFWNRRSIESVGESGGKGMSPSSLAQKAVSKRRGPAR